MLKRSYLPALVIPGLIALAQVTFAAPPTSLPAPAASHPAPHTPNPNASVYAAAVQTILQKFDAERDKTIAQRQALLDQLQSATSEADRKAIIDQMRTEQQTFQDEQRATAKEIRTELQTLRKQRSGG